MTRKKYVKQLMALGIQRNLANAMAANCRAVGRSYEADLRRRRPWLQLAIAARKVKAAFENMADGMATAAVAAAALAAQLRGRNITVQPFTCREEPNGTDCGIEITGRHFHDGLNVVFSTVDEVHTWDPAEALQPIGKEARP